MLKLTNQHRRGLGRLRRLTPRHVRVQTVSVYRRSTASHLLRLVRRVKNVSLCLRYSNVNRRGCRLTPRVRLHALRAGNAKFMHVMATTFHCFTRRGEKRLTIVDSVTKAGKLKTTPTCSTAGHFRGACVSTLRRLTRVRGLPVQFASVHPKFMTAKLLGSNGRCPVLVRARGITHRVIYTLRGGGHVIIVS